MCAEMSGVSTNIRFYQKVKHFPTVINGRINVIEFLAASTDLITIVERLGTLFMPVKLDMQGNIDKIKTYYKYDENSCLLELMLDENAKGKHIAAEGVLWLNRALWYFELMFIELLDNLKLHMDSNKVNMKKIFVYAYEGSVKRYHNWITQQIFNLICKMSPDLPQMMKTLEVDNLPDYIAISELYNIQLHLIRCKIDDFFKDTNILNDTLMKVKH